MINHPGQRSIYDILVVLEEFMSNIISGFYDKGILTYKSTVQLNLKKPLSIENSEKLSEVDPSNVESIVNSKPARGYR